MSNTHEQWKLEGYMIERGTPLPFGAHEVAAGINFSLFSKHATDAYLVLFKSGIDDPVAHIELDHKRNRTGDVWHILVRDVPSTIRYGWRLAGPFDEEEGNRYDEHIILLDPYAKGITGGAEWGHPDIRHVINPEQEHDVFLRRGCLVNADFDWEGDVPLTTPVEDSVIYEMHVRGFTIDASADVAKPGTYLGMTEKIPYLKELGVTAVELMPVFEFDENENERTHPETGEVLRNYWGYSPVAFFAPKASYACNGRDGNAGEEFKEMIKRFHQAGIEVYLDVVFNHTAEGDERGPTLSFRGIDNSIYYILDKDGKYANFSGCGNTFNCNHPLIRQMIIDCLQYWVAEMHVDGFRFDLASILGRGEDGEVLKNPPLLERIALDPVLADTKIIAEAWDAAGLNQVGRFPAHGRWAEWNGYFRDQVRMFWRGDLGMVSMLATRICGSEDLYSNSGRKPYHSINFITAHDGFTLSDLVSYNKKHNDANGEDNCDGENHNHSMNFGVEGPTDDSAIIFERKKMIRNFLVTLFVSQGVPMLLGGDEFCRTQQGNNNAYCQDSPISWVDWSLVEQNADILRFTKLLIALRRRHDNLRRTTFFHGGSGISWHGTKKKGPDWSKEAQWLAFMLDGIDEDMPLFVALNASTEWRHFAVPHTGKEWRKVIDTNAASPDDIFENDHDAPVVGWQHDHFGVAPRSAVVLVGVCPR